ncbi:MAG: ketosteroid isomerase family protein, partial [Cyanobacteria bacterium J06641_5]
LDGNAAVILSYFTSFNRGQYQQAASLFAPDGSLHPPFESPIVGPEQIARYFFKEADGMTISLSTADTQPLGDGRLQVNAWGRVAAFVFQVNAAWYFIVSAEREIESLQIELLATPEELLQIRPD